jgi:glycerate kinase
VNFVVNMWGNQTRAKRPLKILVAPNAFKESLSAMEAVEAISQGLLRALPNAHIIKIPIADGGDGTLEAIVAGTRGKICRSRVLDPLGRRITAEYGITGDGTAAIIEMSRASGLALVPPNKRNPMHTTSYGTGELIKAALKNQVQSILLGIGGSATVDGGIGALQALGVEFMDKRGQSVAPGGEGLLSLNHIDLKRLDPRLRQVQLLVACDVDNPLTGPKGSAAVFGPQKGATPHMVKQLNKALGKLAQLIAKLTGEDVAAIPGAGAAGGISGSFKGLLGAQLRPGSDLVFDLLKVRSVLRDVDLVITGEGRIDFQTPFGKGPGMLAKLAKEQGVPVFGIAGAVEEPMDELLHQGFTAIFSIVNRPMELEVAMKNAASLIRSTTEQVARVIRMSMRKA